MTPRLIRRCRYPETSAEETAEKFIALVQGFACIRALDNLHGPETKLVESIYELFSGY